MCKAPDLDWAPAFAAMAPADTLDGIVGYTMDVIHRLVVLAVEGDIRRLVSEAKRLST